MKDNTSAGRSVAMLVGGLAAGILGSRLLPPLMASMAGARRAKRADDAFDLLINDHRQIERLLDRMAEDRSTGTARRASLFLMLKRKLAKHALAEEDIVYPILHGTGDGAETSKQLYDEHADIKIFLYRIEEAIKNGMDWSEPVHALRDLVRHHIEEEEQDVFPRLRHMMDEHRKGTVSGLISREEAMIL